MQPRMIHLSGTPQEMGREYGRLLREEVHALAEERLRLSMADAAAAAGRAVDRRRCLELAARFLPVQEAYAPAVHAEFLGIADGAGIAPELLLVGNGFTDYKDVLALGRGADECTAFWVRPEAAGGRTLCGQTWDMHATAEPFAILVHRRPDAGPATLSFTTAGCLSLIGINSAGIAIGNNNLVPTDARPGVVYLAMIHRALAAGGWAEAVQAITGARRASGHNYYLADGEGHVGSIETTAERSALLSPEGAAYVHTNHYTAPELAPFAPPPDPESTSRGRERRMRVLLAEVDRPLTPEALRALLAHHDGDAALCVHNTTPDGGKSCGVAVMCPQTREMWVCVGNPCGGALTRIALGDL